MEEILQENSMLENLKIEINSSENLLELETKEKSTKHTINTKEIQLKTKNMKLTSAGVNSENSEESKGVVSKKYESDEVSSPEQSGEFHVSASQVPFGN